MTTLEDYQRSYVAIMEVTWGMGHIPEAVHDAMTDITAGELIGSLTGYAYGSKILGGDASVDGWMRNWFEAAAHAIALRVASEDMTESEGSEYAARWYL